MPHKWIKSASITSAADAPMGKYYKIKTGQRTDVWKMHLVKDKR
jgi:hypothetical protein